MKKFLSLFLLLFLTFSGWYFYSLYTHVNNTMDEIYTPIKRNEVKAENKIAQQNKEKVENSEEREDKPVQVVKPIALLILGIDGNGHKGNRSDAIIIVTMNPSAQKMTLVSIPRDTRTWIVGKGKLDKINHSYAFGGPQMTIDTVEKFLGIPIDYFISVNMKGFKDIIDLLGGVQVNNPFAFTEKGVYIPKGVITLDGREALAFARMRKSDPRGDVGRNERQQLIIQAVMEKGAKLSSLPKAKEFLKVIKANVKTNITLADIQILQQYYQSVNKRETLVFAGKGEKLNHIWYYTITDVDRKKVATQLQKQLLLKENKLK